MTLRVNRSTASGDITASYDIEVIGVDDFMASNPSLCFELIEMLIDKVFSGSNGAEILLPVDSGITD